MDIPIRRAFREALNAVYVLKGGGRLLQCDGLPFSLAINARDRDWLARVNRATLGKKGRALARPHVLNH